MPKYEDWLDMRGDNWPPLHDPANKARSLLYFNKEGNEMPKIDRLGIPVDLEIAMKVSDELDQSLTRIHNAKITINTLVKEVMEHRHVAAQKLDQGT